MKQIFNNFFHYLKNVTQEVKKVKFPAKKEIVSMSVGVLVVIIISGILFYLIDLLSILIINFFLFK